MGTLTFAGWVEAERLADRVFANMTTGGTGATHGLGTSGYKEAGRRLNLRGTLGEAYIHQEYPDWQWMTQAYPDRIGGVDFIFEKWRFAVRTIDKSWYNLPIRPNDPTKVWYCLVLKENLNFEMVGRYWWTQKEQAKRPYSSELTTLGRPHDPGWLISQEELLEMPLTASLTLCNI